MIDLRSSLRRGPSPSNPGIREAKDWVWGLGLMALLGLAGCAGSRAEGGEATHDPEPSPPEAALYFDSPEEAVEIARQLMRAKNWSTLALYYDLDGTAYARADLEDGLFFVRRDRPTDGHPGVWQYRQPFHPAYVFDTAQETEKEGVWKITVRVEIDQGDGMIQRGFDTFEMRKGEPGWQLRPK